MGEEGDEEEGGGEEGAEGEDWGDDGGEEELERLLYEELRHSEYGGEGHGEGEAGTQMEEDWERAYYGCGGEGTEESQGGLVPAMSMEEAAGWVQDAERVMEGMERELEELEGKEASRPSGLADEQAGGWSTTTRTLARAGTLGATWRMRCQVIWGSRMTVAQWMTG